LPVVDIGCDASASWATRYKHLVDWDPVDVIAKKILSYTPEDKWVCSTGQDIHFIITGGEPLMWQRQLEALIRQPAFRDLRNLTFETNCTQPWKDNFDKFMHGLTAGDYTRKPVQQLVWLFLLVLLMLLQLASNIYRRLYLRQNKPFLPYQLLLNLVYPLPQI
jgi:hypothetical protein